METFGRCYLETIQRCLTILDINLNGETSYSIAELLADREVPFLFMSGYSREILPARFSSQPMVKKPMYPGELRTVMTTMLA